MLKGARRKNEWPENMCLKVMRGIRNYTSITARSKARRIIMRIIIHQPDLVSSVSRTNLRIRFIALSSLAPEWSTPRSKSSSILVRGIRLLGCQTAVCGYALGVFDNFLTH